MIETRCLESAEQGRLRPRSEGTGPRVGMSRVVVVLICAFVGRPSGAPPSNVDGRWTERESLGTTRDARASGGTAERDAESPYRQGGPRPDAVTMLRLRSTRGAPSSIHARRSRFDPRAALPLRNAASFHRPSASPGRRGFCRQPPTPFPLLPGTRRRRTHLAQTWCTRAIPTPTPRRSKALLRSNRTVSTGSRD